MPGYFKKRRGAQGPNKNEQKVMRAQKAENQARMVGALSEKFPPIRHLKIHLTFLTPNQGIIDEKNISLDPSDAAVFTVGCPGRCGQGSFDFSGKVAEAVTALLPVSESSAKCAKPLYASATETCGCEVKCRMELAYFPPEEPAPSPDAAPAPSV